MKNFRRWLESVEDWPGEFDIEENQGDGWKITTPHGYIDYRPRPEDGVNEIWWVESRKKGHGSQLVNLMQKHHPADSIAWGVTSRAGEGLMNKYHRTYPHIDKITGPHKGQFDPFGHDDEEDEEDWDWDEEE